MFDLDKVYVVKVKWGEKINIVDVDGEVVECCVIDGLMWELLEFILFDFCGGIE